MSLQYWSANSHCMSVDTFLPSLFILEFTDDHLVSPLCLYLLLILSLTLLLPLGPSPPADRFYLRHSQTPPYLINTNLPMQWPPFSLCPSFLTLFLHHLLPAAATWLVIFSPSLFKSIFRLSITMPSFRSPVGSNTPLRFTWNRSHAQIIHHFSPHCSSLLLSPVSFMHVVVSLHSCSVCWMPPPCFSPHFRTLSCSIITVEP